MDSAAIIAQEGEMARRGYPPEFRRRVVELVEGGRKVAEVACRVLGVSVSGYYEWLNRPLSARALRHTWLMERIPFVYHKSRRTYGVRRVHAELTLGHGIALGREAIARLMRRAGLQGLSRRPRYRKVPNVATAEDRVQRQFQRNDRDQLWVTDITEHRTARGRSTAQSFWTHSAGVWWVGRSTPSPRPRW
jgi:hypothetical protein